MQNRVKRRTFVYVASPVSSSPGGGGERFLDFFTDQFNEVEHVFIGSSRAVHELFRRKGYKAFLSPAGFEPVTPLNLLLLPVSYLLGACQFFRHKKLFESADLILSPTAFCEVFFLFPWLRRFKKKCLHIVLSNKIPNAFIKTFFGKMLFQNWRNDTVIFCSDALREQYSVRGLAPRHTLTIHNGVGIRPFNSARPLPTRSEDVRFGFLARLHREKAPDVLLKAFSLLKPSGMQIRLVIGGDGPYKKACFELSKRLKFPPNVLLEWKGLVADPIAFYESIDALVFPSRREGFSLALLEAWERGVPVLASDIPSFLEAKQKMPAAERQLIFKKDDPADLARLLEYFIGNRAILCGAQNRVVLHSAVEQNFSLDAMIRAYRDAINGMLRREPAQLRGNL